MAKNLIEKEVYSYGPYRLTETRLGYQVYKNKEKIYSVATYHYALDFFMELVNNQKRIDRMKGER